MNLNPKPKRMIIDGLDDDPTDLSQSTIFRADDFPRGKRDDPSRHSISMPLSREPEQKKKSLLRNMYKSIANLNKLIKFSKKHPEFQKK